MKYVDKYICPVKAMVDALQLMKKMSINGKIYQGKIDITEYIDLAKIAEKYNLSPSKYDKLINGLQKIVDKAVKKYLEE